ncbi:MAG: hypothetical protein FP820_02820 [Sulfurimonas sp.]|jgi:hypothetical protein|nr:hypothetical protein [Sulfurimonas sp.]MBU1217569.1 hypothetical protein [bacterium]MBU1433835.1 hypothetical protein [bacterium]MBU1503910.1 hypothetical protein [bacterium]MBU3939054.1 hypothetical protein [bacterium]
MKKLVYIVAFMGMVLSFSGCSTSAQNQLDGLNGNGCNNPKCQCPKPCQCGAGCRCGMNGNTADLNGTK